MKSDNRAFVRELVAQYAPHFPRKRCSANCGHAHGSSAETAHRHDHEEDTMDFKKILVAVAGSENTSCYSYGTSIAQEILAVLKEERFGTVVVGRRGVSKAEEFLFGSVSNKIIHHAKDCTVWVVA